MRDGKKGDVVRSRPKYKTQVPASRKGCNGSKPFRDSSSRAPESVQAKDTQSALRGHARAGPADLDEVAPLVNMGRLLMDFGQYQRAEEVLREAVLRHPDPPHCHYHLGNALVYTEKYAEAASHFKRLTEQDPELNDPMSNIGLSALTARAYCMANMGRWEDAIITLGPAFDFAPMIQRHFARFLEGAENYEGSCFFYSVALLVAPDDFESLSGTGNCHMKMGRLEEAYDHQQKTKNAQPQNPEAWCDFGLTLVKMKRGKQARACFQRALRLDTKHDRAWYELACLDARVNKSGAAFWNLYKSIACGFKDAEHLRRDANFKTVRNDRSGRLLSNAFQMRPRQVTLGCQPTRPEQDTEGALRRCRLKILRFQQNS